MKINVLGLKTDNLTMAEALSETENRLAENARTALVFTPNAEIAYACAKDDGLLSLVNSADIVLPDGDGVLKAAKILGTPLKEKVAGVDYGMGVVSLCAAHGCGLYILGGKPDVAEAAAENLKKSFPTLKISGVHDGYFTKSGNESDTVAAEINSSGAKVLFVCLGFPAQEKWAKENLDKLSNVRLIACLGGSVDVYAGRIRRAPKLFIKCRLEWLWRLMREPRRIGRMTAIPKYLSLAKKRK